MSKRLKISDAARRAVRNQKNEGFLPQSIESIASKLPWETIREIAKSSEHKKQIKWKFEVGDIVTFVGPPTYQVTRGMIIKTGADTAIVSSSLGAQTFYYTNLKLVERLEDDG